MALVSPDPRFLLFPDEFKPNRYLKAALRKEIFEVRIDTNYEAVMRACAKVPRPTDMGESLIEEDMIEAIADGMVLVWLTPLRLTSMVSWWVDCMDFQ